MSGWVGVGCRVGVGWVGGRARGAGARVRQARGWVEQEECTLCVPILWWIPLTGRPVDPSVAESKVTLHT